MVSLEDLPSPVFEGTVPVDDLHVDGANPNQMDEAVFDILCERIEHRGWVGNAIVTDSSGLIADGEHRWMAAKRLGMERVPVKQYDLTEPERRAIRQELNKIHGEHHIDSDIDEIEFLLESEDESSSIAELIEATHDTEGDILDILSDMEYDEGLPEFSPTDPPESQLDESNSSPVECPECGHEFIP